MSSVLPFLALTETLCQDVEHIQVLIQQPLSQAGISKISAFSNHGWIKRLRNGGMDKEVMTSLLELLITARFVNESLHVGGI